MTDGEGCDRLVVASAAPPVDMRVDQLRRWIEEYGIGLVFIDTMGKWLGIEEINDYGPMSQGLDPYNQMVGSLANDCHICFIHHSNKQGGVLGSQAIAGAVDAIFDVKKKREHRTMEISGGRAGAKMEPTVMRFDDETGMVEDGRIAQRPQAP